MKRLLSLAVLLSGTIGLCAQNEENIKEANAVDLPSGKSIYIPNDLKQFDFNDSAEKWNYHNMACTENFVIFWENGFGSDLFNPPALEGKAMSVDIDNLKNKASKCKTRSSKF